ncbi:MAG: hypothetical protein OES37_05965, partial [Chromatiales bacterium]|nr:hypothetical protein [Chromatiales bacterium]
MGELLPELRDFRRDHEYAVRLTGALREKLLVAVLSGPEGVHAVDLCNDRSFEHVLSRQRIDHLSGDEFLFIIVGEDDRPVLLSDVVTLAILCRRVVRGEEDLEDLAICDHGRIEGHLD